MVDNSVINRKKVSIIVPVYNAELYLEECIKSLIQQSYKNIEILLIDDGSTDNSPDICDAYSQRYDSVFVVHKKNAGTASARNVGMQIAKGEYFAFVDSDDVVNCNYINNLVIAQSETGADVVQCMEKHFYRDSEIDTEKGCARPSITEIIQSRNAQIQMFGPDSMKYGVVWNKLYLSEKFKEILFPNDKMNEDTYWTNKIYQNIDKMAIIRDELYYYRYVKGSKEHSKITSRNMAVIDFYYDMRNQYSEDLELLILSEKHGLEMMIELYRKAVITVADKTILDKIYSDAYFFYNELCGFDKSGAIKLKYKKFFRNPVIFVKNINFKKNITRLKQKINKMIK